MPTPTTVHYPASSNPDEILVSGTDENGHLVNLPILTDADLAKELRETPAMIPNPAHADLTARVLEAASENAKAHAEAHAQETE